MEHGDPAKIKEKLVDFNGRVAASGPVVAPLSLDASEYKSMLRVFDKLLDKALWHSVDFAPTEIAAVQKALKFPEQFLFPCMRCVRACACVRVVCLRTVWTCACLCCAL